MNPRQIPLPGHGAIEPWGLCVHTTGDGIPKRAHQQSRQPMDVAVDAYSNMREGPHYVIDPWGKVIQFRGINERAWHVGMSAEHRRRYLGGSWEEHRELEPEVVRWWKERWPGRKSPAHLYPSKAPNSDYLGVEMVPCGTWVDGKGSWTALWGTVPEGRSRYSVEQYTALARLCVALERETGWPAGWMDSSRLVGHEDVNLITRPGYDPGAYKGRFSWTTVKAIVSVLRQEAYQ